MKTDWLNVGKPMTEGVEHEFTERFEKTEWEEYPCRMAFSQGYAMKEIVRSFNLAATHVGEIPYHSGTILAVRAECSQGVGELFVHDDGNQTLTPLAVQKYWEN